jgi:diguanylate cyclase (GGDEF)-like protein
MEKALSINKLYENNKISLPNFFDFIEADVSKVFGGCGSFIVFNIYNLTMINEECGRDIGDLCISGISSAIRMIVLEQANMYGFRFGNNDFIITLPNSLSPNIDKITTEVDIEFHKYTDEIDLSIAKLNWFSMKYDDSITSVEDFYELLFNNASQLGENEKDSRRIIRHIIGTFTNKVRSAVSFYRDANNLAFTDDVSGLSNHRAGEIFIFNLIDEYSKSKPGFTVLFIDGDDLKRYNKISYEAGNKMIKDIGQIITNSVRNEDKVFRWLSGDEFLVVVQGMDRENSLKLAERVRESVEKQTSNYIYPTTISIGVSHYPNDGSSIDEIIKKAEKANAYAKGIGKNKVAEWDVKLEDGG